MCHELKLDEPLQILCSTVHVNLTIEGKSLQNGTLCKNDNEYCLHIPPVDCHTSVLTLNKDTVSYPVAMAAHILSPVGGACD